MHARAQLLQTHVSRATVSYIVFILGPFFRSLFHEKSPRFVHSHISLVLLNYLYTQMWECVCVRVVGVNVSVGVGVGVHV